jgi:hypothetical protein
MSTHVPPDLLVRGELQNSHGVPEYFEACCRFSRCQSGLCNPCEYAADFAERLLDLTAAFVLKRAQAGFLPDSPINARSFKIWWAGAHRSRRSLRAPMLSRHFGDTCLQYGAHKVAGAFSRARQDATTEYRMGAEPLPLAADDGRANGLSLSAFIFWPWENGRV